VSGGSRPPRTAAGAIVAPSAGGVVIRVKAVPGASRDAVAGAVGDRLKVRVAAPPEGGKANRAIERLIAAALGVKRGRVSIVTGQGGPEKSVRVEGLEVDEARKRLGLAPDP
jgi:uncharacterized protein (TIGR00251 family)